MASELTPELVLRAYRVGAFPMANSRQGTVHWYCPDPRAILPLQPDAFHIPRSLQRILRQNRFTLTRDHAFEAVLQGCAAPRPYADETWINDDIARVFLELHHQGFAHSIEAWTVEPDAAHAQPGSPGWRLAGGLYGLAIGGAFFAESKFTRQRDASKVCLVHLVHHLRKQGFSLLDVQINNPHIARFGVIDIPRETYLQHLQTALTQSPTW